MDNTILVIFTDLDATLVDHFTYSWDDAQPALDLLFLLKIPIVTCTSKTKDESIYYRGQLGLKHPFIVENGAAIYSPFGYFNSSISEKLDGGYEIKEFGVSYSVLREFLKRCKNELKIKLSGFGDLDAKQIQELTGLNFHLAELAKRRNYNEPFYFLNETSELKIEEMKKLASGHQLKITKGGRFYHVSGAHDKGFAVNNLVEYFKKNQSEEVVSIGIGDSLNDLSMLQNVTIPCLVKNGKGKYNQDVLEKISPRLAGEMGPKGWNKVVLEILDEYSLTENYKH